MKNKILNFWYYHKVHIFVALAILAMGVYFILTSRTVVQSDYDIAIVSAQGCSEEQMAQIRDVFQQAGKDLTGDGAVTVNLHLYRFALGEEGQDREAIAGLDADLVGNVSGIFFVDDPERFEEATNGLGRSADAIPVSGIPALSGCGMDHLSLLIRTNTDEKYSSMLSALTR
ncbi:MAG: hypothetical protein IJI14_04590 [Anaerolineaceae bacterium]|nr:hypothetical protein [Anaerolineaceae bacterium]